MGITVNYSKPCLTGNLYVTKPHWWRNVLDQHAELDFYSASSLKRASSLKQQSAGRHVAPLGHIILIPSQPVFVLPP
jgi:hypothetical protein